MEWMQEATGERALVVGFDRTFDRHHALPWPDCAAAAKGPRIGHTCVQTPEARTLTGGTFIYCCMGAGTAAAENWFEVTPVCGSATAARGKRLPPVTAGPSCATVALFPRAGSAAASARTLCSCIRSKATPAGASPPTSRESSAAAALLPRSPCSALTRGPALARRGECWKREVSGTEVRDVRNPAPATPGYFQPMAPSQL